MSCYRIKSYRKALCVAASLLGLAFFTACVASPIALKKTHSVSKDEGVVFGRVKVLSEGKEWKDFSGFFGESKMNLLVLPTTSSQVTYYPLGRKGYFFWHLASGDYVIAGFEGINPGFFSYGIKGRVFARFKVVPEASTYIGTLGLIFVGNRYIRAVEDEYSAAVDEYINRFAKTDMDIRKDLMVMEETR